MKSATMPEQAPQRSVMLVELHIPRDGSRPAFCVFRAGTRRPSGGRTRRNRRTQARADRKAGHVWYHSTKVVRTTAVW